MLVGFTETDFLEEARGRVTEAFKGKDVFDRYLQLLMNTQDEIQQVFKDLLQKRSIDEATGAQLDIIGDIVGQPRELISADLFDFFGFQGALKAGSFGDVNNSVLGSKFYDYGQPTGGNVLLDDETYRLFIKAKILKNRTASTPEEFLSFINFLLGTDTTYISETGNASYIVMFGRELSTFEKTLLNYTSSANGYPSRLIPKTVGVRINFGYFLENEYFGFQGAPGAKGFGDVSILYGYGLSYGLAYGGSGGYDLLFNGDFTYDGSNNYNSHIVSADVLTEGGVFATLF